VANYDSLLLNPERFAKNVADGLYETVVETATDHLMELLRPTVEEEVKKNLSRLKAYMERNEFHNAVMLKVILNDEELT
jgi:hypothetical protein